MKNGMIRLIAMSALFFGVIGLYRIVAAMVYQPPTSSSNIVRDIVLSWIALYGGYQAMRLKLIGHRLLLVYFAIQTVFAIFFVVMVIFAIFLSPGLSIQSFSISPSQIGTAHQKFIYAVLSFSLCILSLIFLRRENIASNFQPESGQRHFEIIGKILSLLAPGLGGAMVRNLWVGIILFFVYFFLSKSFLIFGAASGPIINGVDMGLLTGWFLRVLPKLIVWAFFFQIDLALVKEVVKAQNVVPEPAQELLSEQSSG